jgi:broad specificity phosphatase PhoE
MRQSLHLFLILLAISLFTQVRPLQAQDLTTFILVRHAEKVNDGTADPALDEAGKQRAQKLADHLELTDLTAIYSTPYRRTRETAAPTAQRKGLDIREYDPADSQFLHSLLQEHAGGTVLVMGHSNTTPFLVNQLIGSRRYEQLHESDYANLFIVTVSDIGKGRVVRLTY